MVERQAFNLNVAGSTPAVGFNFIILLFFPFFTTSNNEMNIFFFPKVPSLPPFPPITYIHASRYSHMDITQLYSVFCMCIVQKANMYIVHLCPVAWMDANVYIYNQKGARTQSHRHQNS